jgi:hypothetical protein
MIMKKIWTLFAAISLMFASCQFETSTSSGISVDDSELARITESEIQPSDDGVFSRGEDIDLILYNVGPFKEGEDGLHWFDMDLEVLDEDGNVVFSQTEMLGDNGHLKLENGIAGTPYATFSPNESMDAGKYRMKVHIYDRVGDGKATVTKSFTLK